MADTDGCERPAKVPRTSTASKSLQSLRYDAVGKTLEVLDQTRVPHATTYIAVPDSESAWQVIRSMQVRGAPLIGIVAALGLAVEANCRSKAEDLPDAESAAKWLSERLGYLKTSRPTAVNLTNYAALLSDEAAKAAGICGASSTTVLEAYIVRAEKLLEEDLRDNIAIGDLGADAVLHASGKKKVNVLTVCNTGSLATAGYGTALGVVRSLHKQGALERVYACETRPYNQGARLTAFEILADELPGTLICDNMAAFLMKKGNVDAVVVGCDRIAANGDFANKIGTYSLAVSAKHHGVPFFVAGVSGTIDLGMASGDSIPIEERPSNELTEISAPTEAGGTTKIQIAPTGTEVWNPAFDVTPGDLVRGIVTERGVLERKVGDVAFDLPSHFRS